MNGSLVLILHTHLPYVLHHGKWPHGSDWLSEAAAECYIPILNECWALIDEGIVPNVTISLSPVVVEQLADPAFARVFNDYLDEKIESAVSDRAYFRSRRAEQHYVPLTDFWERWYMDRRRDFNERYGCDLVRAFGELADAGGVALQTCGATHGYFPLLGRDESVSAQLGVAVASHTARFGSAPRGVWMPECAYRPCYYWRPPVGSAPEGMRLGVEQLIARHGLEYSVVDSHLTRGGRPVATYAERLAGSRVSFDSDAPAAAGRLPLGDSRSVYDLYRVCSTSDPDAGMMTVFTRDAETTMRVWSGSYGYPGDPEYLEFHKKHHNSGHRYWRVTDSSVDLAVKTVYRPERVAACLRIQAEHFVAVVERELDRFHAATGREGVLTAPFDTELFGHWWFEGPRFLGEVLRCLARRGRVRARTAVAELDAREPGRVIQIPEGSWGDGGGHRVWLNDETAWTWPKIYQTEERFLTLVNGEPAAHNADAAALDERLLLQMAREQMLLEASDWQFLITTASAADYATERFNGHFEEANWLGGRIERLRAGSPLSLEDAEHLARLESSDRLFPDLTLDHWRARRA